MYSCHQATVYNSGHHTLFQMEAIWTYSTARPRYNHKRFYEKPPQKLQSTSKNTIVNKFPKSTTSGSCPY